MVNRTPKPTLTQTDSTTPVAAPDEAALIHKPDPTLDLLRKKELLDTVAERSGVKRKDVKLVVEALLATLGETLDAGRQIQLPPLGKVKINRILEKENGNVLICRLRRPAKTTPEAVAPDADKS